MSLQYGTLSRKRELPRPTVSRDEQPHIITAQLSDSHRCKSLGIVAAGNTPVLSLCRSLLAAGLNADLALHIYRTGTLALRVKSSELMAGASLLDYLEKYARIDAKFCPRIPRRPFCAAYFPIHKGGWS